MTYDLRVINPTSYEPPTPHLRVANIQATSRFNRTLEVARFRAGTPRQRKRPRTAGLSSNSAEEDLNLHGLKAH